MEQDFGVSRGESAPESVPELIAACRLPILIYTETHR
jgi:hypothetical protein